MLTFTFKARDSASGQLVKSEVQADSEQAAAKAIAGQGLAPLDIKLKSTGSGFVGKATSRVKTKDRIIFSRQLSTLINAGLPLVQSLRNVTRQITSKSLASVSGQIIADIEAGSTFSKALARHPEVFNTTYVSLIEAGEASGTLDKALERIANQQEKDAELISKVRGAMAYPAIVLLVMGGVVGFMIVKVLPQVEGIYKGLPGAKLPLITVILLTISHFITDYWYFVLGALALLGFFLSRYARSGPGKEIVDKVKMKAWPVGPLFMKMYMARFSRTGNTLVASGVPLIQMLEITASSVNNVHIARSIHNSIEKIKGGKSLADSLDGDAHFLELVPNMIRIGEQSGSLEAMLDKCADYYEKEVDNQIKTVSTLIEPLLMVVLGVVAFTVVAAVLLPIYSLAGKSGFGG